MNEVVKFKGIVLKELAKGESDKSITVMAKGFGILNLSARGAKNSKSKFLAGAQAFSYCDFVCFKGKNFYSLNEVTVIDSFYNIRLDYSTISAAFYFCEMVEKTVLPGEPCDDILLLLLKTFFMLSKSDFNIKLMIAVFELKFLVLNGFTPAIDLCAICGKKTDNNWISPQAGGVVCLSHSGAGPIKLEKGTYLAMNYIIKSDMNKLYSFTADDHVVQNLFAVSKQFLKIHLDIELKSAGFLVL